MEICKLCKVNEATKTNSHIITLALIKDCFNQNGFNDRDHNVTFAISSFKTPQLHTGRSVLPNHMKTFSGSNTFNEEVIHKKDFFTKDYILCPTCEDGIGKIESEFINRVYNKIHKVTTTNLLIDKKGNKMHSLTVYDSKLTMLFGYSIFFRTSIVRFNNYALDLKLQEKISAILLRNLPINQSQLEKNIVNSSVHDFCYPLVLTYFETNPDDLENKNIVTQNHCDMPYYIWANRLGFQLFRKVSHMNSTIQFLYGLGNMLNAKEYLPDQVTGQMNIGILSEAKRKKMLFNALQIMVHVNMDNMMILFSKVCLSILKRKATEYEKRQFRYHYSQLSTDEIHKTFKDPFRKAVEETLNIRFEG